MRPTSTVVAITAFPTGDKGTGTEATCELWSDRLQFAEQVVDEATTVQDKVQAVNELNQDIDDALEAGCAVIYSAAPTSQLERIKTVRLAAALRGGTLTTTWAPGPSVAYISAYPTGGKGSATEATCRLWTDRLEEDQAIIDNAPETDKQDAGELLERDIDNALDAGCFVIH